jgi:hypothetical protein
MAQKTMVVEERKGAPGLEKAFYRKSACRKKQTAEGMILPPFLWNK